MKLKKVNNKVNNNKKNKKYKKYTSGMILADIASNVQGCQQCQGLINAREFRLLQTFSRPTHKRKSFDGGGSEDGYN